MAISIRRIGVHMKTTMTTASRLKVNHIQIDYTMLYASSSVTLRANHAIQYEFP